MRITDKRLLAPRVAAITIEAQTKLDWQAGQYVHIHAGGHAAKPYSIAGGDAGRVTLHIAPSGAGKLSDYLFHDATAGEAIAIEGVYGTSPLPRLQAGDRPVVMLAGGTGLAPIAALAHHISGDYTIYHAVRNADAFYAPAAGLQATPIIEANGALPHTHIDWAGHEGALFYLAGPPAMISACKQVMREQGIDEQDIVHG